MNYVWDYTPFANTYDNRPDYSKVLLDDLFTFHNLDVESLVLDCGAGTGKLTKELIREYTNVIASEPNDAMRKIGIKNLNGKNCKWLGDSAEKISVSDNSISSVWFGSSFNLVDHPKVFAEFNRYSRPRAWITCLWNHRNLTDPLQKEIENILKLKIRDFDYGLRRKDPTLLMKDSGLLGGITKFETDFHVQVETKEWIKAWSSHATLRRQCKDETQFQNILREISRSVQNFDSLLIPYTTRAWTGQLLNNMKI